MRESYFAKAKRLLAEGRVRLLRVDGGDVDAEVRGDSAGLYHVTHRPGAWHCNCDALSRCSHVQAVMLVVTTVSHGEDDGARRVTSVRT